MKASQRIALKMSETREQLNALLAMDELTDDQRADMATFSTRMQQLEIEARAAILAEDVPTITTHDRCGRRGPRAAIPDRSQPTSA